MGFVLKRLGARVEALGNRWVLDAPGIYKIVYSEVR